MLPFLSHEAAVRPHRPATARVYAIAALLALTLGLVAVQLRANVIAADVEAQTRAEHELATDVDVLRAALAAPARDARTTAASLRVLLAETVAGAATDDDTEALTRIRARASALRGAADQLDTTAASPQPQRPADLPADGIDAVMQRLGPVDAQAHATADLLRDAAVEAVATAAAAQGLHAAVAALVDHTQELPDGDDPEVIAAAWADEAELRTAYLDAIEVADAIPALAALTAVHRDLAERLTAVADEGAAALADGDLDAYNEQLAEQLGELDAEELRAELREATATALAAAVADVETAEEHALGLLHELERLRRDTPSLVASG
jgi:trimeric autotransporter adhesin